MPWIEYSGKQFRVNQGTTILDPAPNKGCAPACQFVNKTKSVAKPVAIQEPEVTPPVAGVPPFAKMRATGVTLTTLCNMHLASLSGQISLCRREPKEGPSS